MARRRQGTKSTPRREPTPIPVNGSGAGANVSPPNAGGAETTGRFLVVYKDSVLDDPKEAERALREHAGIKATVSAADFDDSVVAPEQAVEADAVYFPALGIAAVAADSDQLQSLMSVASDDESSILAVEPEYVYYALQGVTELSRQYLHGYRDAVNHLYDQLVSPATEAEELGITAAFQDTAQFTWGFRPRA